MKKNLIFFALAAIMLASCNGGYQTGENGMLYKIYTKKNGPKIHVGDFVNLSIIVTNEADSVISSTYEKGGPEPRLVPEPKFKGDIFSAMQMLTEGDSASIKLPTDSLFKTGPHPPMFKGKYVIYTVKIEKLIAKGNLPENEFETTVNNYLNTETLALKNSEPVKIKIYIAQNKLIPTKTDSGLYYVISQKGTGAVAAKNDTVVVNYTGKLVNGKVFETTIKENAIKADLPASERPYVPVRIPIGQHRVMQGWDLGLLLFNKGTKATLIIPSSLAYGEKGNELVGPFTPLVFDIEVVDIIHPKPTTNPGAQSQIMWHSKN